MAQHVSAYTLMDDDLLHQALFIGENDNIQATQLSNQEMQTTQGAFWWAAPVAVKVGGDAIKGGISGGASYAIDHRNKPWSAKGFYREIAKGAIKGAVVGVVGKPAWNTVKSAYKKYIR